VTFPERDLPTNPAIPPRISRIVLIGLVCCCAFLRAPVANAAGKPAAGGEAKPYALIFGTVWGPDDRPLYGVKVMLRREGDKKPKWEQYSDHQGEFAFRVPAGKATYYASPDWKGYKLPDGSKLQPAEEVKVDIQNDERSDIGLHLK
jgi:hypothetical protein